MEEKYFGHSVIRKEGRDKVMGRARYVDDLSVPGMLHGAPLDNAGRWRNRLRGLGSFSFPARHEMPGFR